MGRNVTNAPNDIINVKSSTGFNVGDYIYYYSGDFITPVAGTILTGDFPGSYTMPLKNAVSHGGDSWLLGSNGHMGRTASGAAKLTSNNIVIAYAGVVDSGGFKNYPCFKIIDEDGNTVVAETQIEATAIHQAMPIAVTALSGGGFAIGWITTARNLRHAVYTNTGTVTTAAATDTGATWSNTVNQGGSTLSMCSRPSSGGYVVAFVQSSGQVAYKIFNSVGAQAYAWTTTGLFSSNTNMMSAFVTCRSTDSLIITGYSSGQLKYQIFSNTNVDLIGVGTVDTILDTSANNHGHCATLTNDSTIICYTVASSNVGKFKILNSLNGLGAATSVVGQAYTGGNGRVTSLKNGGFAIFSTNKDDITVQNTPPRTPNYQVFNSAGSRISSTYPYTNFYSVGYNGDLVLGTPIETNNYIHFIYSGPYRSNVSNTASIDRGASTISGVKLYNSSYSQVFKSSYTVGGYSSFTANTGTLYKALSTPSKVGYIAGSNTVSNVNFSTSFGGSNGQGALTGSVTITTNSVAPGVWPCPLPDGNVAVVWAQYNAPYYLYLAKVTTNYNGSILQSVSSPVEVSSGAQWFDAKDFEGNTSVTALDNGKIVVGYKTSNTAQSKISVFYSNLTLQNTVTLSISSSYPSIGVSALTGNNYVVGYPSTSGPTVAVYDHNNQVVSAATTVDNTTNPASNVGVKVCGTVTGGFVVKYFATAANYTKYAYYINSAANTWVCPKGPQTDANTTYNYPANTGSNMMLAAPDGGVYSITRYSQGLRDSTIYPYGIINYGDFTLSSGNNNYIAYGQALTVDGYGVPSYLLRDKRVTNYTYYGTPTDYDTSNFYVFARSTPDAANANNSSFGSYIQINAYEAVDANFNFWMTGVPSWGHKSFVAYLDGSGYPTLGVFTNLYSSLQVPISANVSTGTANINSSLIFSGISITPAAANGIGAVLVNGTTTLNSDYQSLSTTNFNTLSSNVNSGVGVYGWVNGRNVTLHRPTTMNNTTVVWTR